MGAVCGEFEGWRSVLVGWGGSWGGASGVGVGVAFTGCALRGGMLCARSVPTRCVGGLVLRGACVCVAHFGRRALESKEEVLGAKHPDTLASVNNLGSLLHDKGDYDAAEPLYRCGGV